MNPVSKHVIDEIYESDGEELISLLDHFFFLDQASFGKGSFLNKLRINIHLLFCSRCFRELKRLESVREIMRTAFFPPSPGIEKTIMEKIAAETEDVGEFSALHHFQNPRSAGSFESGFLYGGFSTRGWIIAGCFMLFSLLTVFFDMNFVSIAAAQGEAFLLPLGLTIGGMLTAYCALFIGSHLKELSSRFGLR
jgi:hypothetical protein